jgi:hypothetical protein
MSTPSSRKTYTRRNTRTRLIDLLKEAIELVEKGCPAGHMTRGPTSALPLAAPVSAKLAKGPLSAIPEENLVTQSKSLLASSQVELEKGRALELQAQEILKTQGAATVKPKGAPRPGVLRYNEFVKNWISKHPEYQAKGKYQAALKEIQRSGNWDRVSGTRKKTKAAAVTATPARLSPTLALNANAANANANASTANSTPSTASTANSTPSTASTANSTPSTASTANSTPSTASTLATLAQNNSYTNEGMNDTVGMRKISMNGRSLYMSSDNGLFERDGDAPGDFVGRLVDGKIVEEEAPELPEYS